jgi:hypothetical protein
LLTKMLVARLLHVLPDVLKASQLCSVRGRSIFDGAAAILSVSEYLHRRNLPGFLLSLDFFHAFDRVSLQWLDRVLEAMGFGLVLRQWVATLHRHATACFMLHSLSPDQEVEFSIRQGDPAASVFFTIYIEPFLACLERFLRGLFMGGLREATLSYMDDVNELGEDEQDILVTDELCRAFEAASGAILNRNRKTVILGLGSWAGRSDWPLPWLQAVDQAKVFGVTYTPVFSSTVSVSWDRVTAGVERALQMWSARRLPTLRQCSSAVETFALSKAWYLAQILPLPPATTARLRRAAGDFLWCGRFERLAHDELHGPLSSGGLRTSAIQTRAVALLAKQACHRLAGGGRPARHIAYWVGLRLRHRLPDLGAGLHAEDIPPFYKDLASLLEEVLTLPGVNSGALLDVSSKFIYIWAVYCHPAPPLKIEARLPDLPWRLIWGRLAGSSLPGLLVDHMFSLLHNILLVQDRCHCLRLAPSPHCDRCPGLVEDVLHFFTSCSRVEAAWAFLAFRVALLVGGPVPDRSLLFFAWPASRWDPPIALAVAAYAALAWETQEEVGLLLPTLVRARVDGAAAEASGINAISIFSL